MKFLIIAAIMVSSIHSFCQVFKLKAYQSYFKKTGDDHKIREEEWINIDFLVVVNIDKNKINTYGEKKGDYDIIKYKGNETDKDGNIYWTWDTIDEDGDKCEAFLITYADKSGQHIATLTFIYPFGVIYLRLKKDE